ncbi:MAG: histidine kinase [Bacteroidota bacterium]
MERPRKTVPPIKNLLSTPQLQPYLRVVRKLDYWLIALVLIIVIIAIGKLRKTNEVEERLTSRSIPMQLYALQIATSMDEQKAALIRYLVEGDSVQKQIYEAMEADIEGLVRSMILISDQPEEESIIQQVDWLMDELDAKGRLVLGMDESVDENYLDISESIDDIDDLLDKEIVPYVDNLTGTRRERLEESTGELETGIQECLLALSEYIMQRGAEESRMEFLEARSNIQLWENIFIETAKTPQERRWARMLNENMDIVILKADELMLNFDRRMEEYNQYSEMEVHADDYIENNLLALGAKLVNADLKSIRQERTVIFGVALISLGFLIVVLLIGQRNRLKREEKLKQMELQYRDSQIKAIIQSQEVERSRYAQDLHDNYGQLIAVLKLNLQTLERQWNSQNKETTNMFAHSNQVLQTMSDDLRRICFGLMPITLKERGLPEALRELCYNINGIGTLTVKFHSKGEFNDLDENQKITLFRICQEWLNNILKHSNAGLVKINVVNSGKGFQMMIEDDGTGFHKQELFDSQGHGWKNIQSRSRILGAQVHIQSSPQETGNKFFIWLPYEEFILATPASSLYFQDSLSTALPSTFSKRSEKQPTILWDTRSE